MLSPVYSYAASNRKSFAPVDRCQEYNQGCKNIIKKYGYKEKDFKITQACTDDKAKVSRADIHARAALQILVQCCFLLILVLFTRRVS